MNRRLLHVLGAVLWASFGLLCHPVFGGAIVVSQPPPNSPPSSVAGGISLNPVISTDGRYVLFASTANNLVAASPGKPFPEFNPAVMNVFMRDRQSGSISLVSISASGTVGANADSFPLAISTNGQFALFSSAASNLVSTITTGFGDLYVRDAVNNSTLLVSLATNGLGGNGKSEQGVMTPDGRYVAFKSAANNLVPNDTNGIPDIFVRDLRSNVTTLASPGAGSSLNANFQPPLVTAGPSSEFPLISADGRYVTFYSSAPGLVQAVTNADALYVRDLVNAATTWATANLGVGNTSPVPTSYVFSSDGQHIAYQTWNNADPASGTVFRYNLATGLTDSICTNGLNLGALSIDDRPIDMTSDGRFVAFLNVSNSGATSMHLWDSETGSNTLISSGATNTACGFPRFDTSGRYLAFIANETALTSNSDGNFHIYVANTLSNTVQMADIGTNGATPISFVTTPFAFGSDGNFVAFGCFDGAYGSNPDKSDVFARNLLSNTTEIISAPNSSLPTATALGSSELNTGSVSSNGQFVAFTGIESFYLPNDTNSCEQVFLHDFSTGSNILISVAADGLTPGNFGSFSPVISADGRYVAFASDASNLLALDTNITTDVYLRDTKTGITTLVSVNNAGTAGGNGNSYSPQISADGQRVLFFSVASDLTTNSLSSGVNLFWRGIPDASTIYLNTHGIAGPADMTPDGANVLLSTGQSSSASATIFLWNATTNGYITIFTDNTNGPARAVALSSDAHYAAFGFTVDAFFADLVAQTNVHLGQFFSSQQVFSFGGNYFASVLNDHSGTNQIYLYDLQSSARTLVTQTYNSTNGSKGHSYLPNVSADGRYVAYLSAATDLVPGDDNGFRDVFLYDRLAKSTTLITSSALGPFSANAPSFLPQFSGDGRTLFFSSWASDLVPNDLNHSSDVFAIALPGSALATNAAASTPLTFSGIASETNSGVIFPGQPLMLTFPSVPGVGYQIQFTGDLNPPDWQPLGSPATIVGGQGSVVDPFPGSPTRFYRIVTF